MTRKITVEIGGFEAYISTNRFEQLCYDSQEILASRLLNLPFVIETCAPYGWFKIKFDDFNQLPEMMATLKKYLEPRIAKGEGIRYGEYHYSLASNKDVRTVHYVPGEVSIA